MQRRTDSKRTGGQLEELAHRDADIGERLNFLIAANIETEIEAARFRTPAARLEFETMRDPIRFERALALFGLLIGAFVPFTIFAKATAEYGLSGPVFGVFLLVNAIAAAAGYFSGPAVARILERVGERGSFQAIVSLPFIGMLWGAVVGALSGVLIMVIGAFFGGIVGGAVGLAVLPAFVILYNLISVNGTAESRRFWPIAVGITACLCATVLGL